ncbi:MAG: hypothetical protein BGO10_01960 [Chlamydia sp. 32-24]|nr:MAG: hypothetical protein BGO10_01960 [Chlamydia sp. 32-24]
MLKKIKLKKNVDNMKKKVQTSWENVNKWYKKIVGNEGHYYHQQVILPNIAPILSKHKAILDLACGTGILGRAISKETIYQGFDISPSFIKEAIRLDPHKNHVYTTADVSKDLHLKSEFTLATIILALQNIENAKGVLQNCAKGLKNEGQLLLVLNHPYYRIPRQSSWGIDEGKKIQYRRVDRYMESMAIPIEMHPGQKEKTQTFSFHHPLSLYTKWLKETGFVIDEIEEWVSDKESTGKNAKMENRARQEIPLFMCIKAIKIKG